MRRTILQDLRHLLCLALVVVAWFVCARSISLLLDRIHTREVESHFVSEIGTEDVSGGMLRIDRLPFSLAGPDNKPGLLRMNLTENGQLLAAMGFGQNMGGILPLA